MKRILAVSSSGGHWIQLMRIRPAFEGHDVAFVTTRQEYAVNVKGARFYLVPDATRWSRFAFLKMFLKVSWIVIRERPEVIISTGAAPGLAAIYAGYLVNARSIWIDSIANVDRMSMSGRMAKQRADLVLTQWEHVAKQEGIEFFGRVL